MCVVKKCVALYGHSESKLRLNAGEGNSFAANEPFSVSIWVNIRKKSDRRMILSNIPTSDPSVYMYIVKKSKAVVGVTSKHRKRVEIEFTLVRDSVELGPGTWASVV